jgi:putative transposase
MIDTNNKGLSVRKQTNLLSLNRSSLYVKHQKQDTNAVYISNLIAEIYSDYPMYGYRRITAILRRQSIAVSYKKVRRLMKLMNIKAIYPGPNTSKRNLRESVYPHLLKGLDISKPNQVWQTDITYLRTNHGFVYLVALIDVYSRLVVGYNLSNTLCTDSCLIALENAVSKYGKADIINSDQGSQFTSSMWINKLTEEDITISMTSTGRSNDNAYIERLWRSFKYEGSYLYQWRSVADLKINIPKWISWYNTKRPYQALEYETPSEVYCGFMDNFYKLPTTPQYQQLQDYNYF